MFDTRVRPPSATVLQAQSLIRGRRSRLRATHHSEDTDEPALGPPAIKDNRRVADPGFEPG